MPNRALLSICLIGLWIFAGCSTSNNTTGSEEETETILRTTVQVENRSLHDLNIFVYYGSQRFRLGNVRSSSTRELKLPQIVSDAGGVVLFVADGIGVPNNSLPFYRQELFIDSGETVRFSIPSI